MDALKSQLLRIQEQLSGLSASQKMLTASLVAIMVMTILWWGRFAGTAQMEAVLEQSLSSADMGQMRAALGMQGINAVVTGDRLMVPADRRYEALAVLAYNNKLPSNSYTAWDEMLKQSTLWDSSTKTAELHKHMKERLLSDWMSAHFPGVADAQVLINDVAQRRMGASLQPSATVMIKTRGSADVKKVANAAAAAVASAVSGLAPQRVAVIVDGKSHRVADTNSGFSGEADEKARELEDYYTQKLVGVLPEGSRIAVSVEVDTTRKHEETQSFERARSLQMEKEIDQNTTENSQPAPPPADSGAVTNTGLSLAQPTAAGASNTTDSNRTLMENHAGGTRSTTETPPGKANVFSTAIRIPRSYFIRVLSRGESAQKEPDEATIQTRFDKEKPELVRTAKAAIGMRSEENISIEMLYDDGLMLAGAAEPKAAGMGLGSMVGNHMREVAVGGLAVLSLFMLMSIVKKGTPAPIVAVPEAPHETPRLASGEDLAGIVGDTNATLDGMELDDSAVKAQQMVDQVATMVKENPDAAANMVKRWMNRS